MCRAHLTNVKDKDGVGAAAAVVHGRRREALAHLSSIGCRARPQGTCVHNQSTNAHTRTSRLQLHQPRKTKRSASTWAHPPLREIDRSSASDHHLAGSEQPHGLGKGRERALHRPGQVRLACFSGWKSGEAGGASHLMGRRRISTGPRTGPCTGAAVNCTWRRGAPHVAGVAREQVHAFVVVDLNVPGVRSDSACR